MRLTLLLFGIGFGMTAAATDILLERQTPPPFGHRVGSVLPHRLDLFAPRPWRLDPATLPPAGPLASWLEVRRVTWRQEDSAGGHRYRVEIDYQIFPDPKAPPSWQLPPLTLRFHRPDTGATRTVTVPSWRFTVAALTDVGQPEARIPLRPLWQPSPRPLAPHGYRLAALITWLGAVLLAIAWRRRWLPWRRPPFARRRRAFRRALAAGDPATALRLFHRALDETAGHALFAHQLDGFLRRRPAFADREDALREFFRLSRRTFFGDPPAAVDANHLETLYRACLEAEKRCRT